MNNSTAIKTQKLQKHFGEVHALNNVDLTITQGQIFGLLGSNGAGKTTLIRLMVGATKPTAGQLSVLGQDPTTQKYAVRRHIGYMPQAPALYEDLSPLENIRFFGRAHKVENISQRIEEIIEFVGLTERAKDQVYKFSGGMKQRVSLACALVHQPKILLLDEPTSGIDPNLREAFWEHFRELADQGVTILISTHQMDEAMYCDQLGILHRGDLLAQDTPRNLLWEQHAKVKITQGGKTNEHNITNYPNQLPGILQKHGLDPSITRIEVKEETLENVILRLIKNHQEAAQ